MKRTRLIQNQNILIIPLPDYLKLTDDQGVQYSMELHIIKKSDHIYKDLNLISLVPQNKVAPIKRKKSSVEERNDLYLPLAKYLSKIIKHRKNINHSTSQLNMWATDIRRYAEQSGVSYERIETALQWYRRNVGREWIPVIESGSSLRSKFMRLEDAMERDINPFKPKQQNKPDITDDGIRYVWNAEKKSYVHGRTGKPYIP